MSFYGQPQYNGTQQQSAPVQPSSLPYPAYPPQINQTLPGAILNAQQTGHLPYNPGVGAPPYPQSQSLGFGQGAALPYPQPGSGYSFPGPQAYHQPNQAQSVPQPQGPGISQPSQGSTGHQYSGMSSSHSQPSGPGYPTGPNQPGYPTGANQAGYPTGGSQPGYPTGANQPGYPTGASQPGYPAGAGQPGFPTGANQSGYPTGTTQPGYPSGANQPGYPTGASQPGYPSGTNQPGYPAGPGQPGYPTGANQPGYPAGAGQPGYPTGANQPGYPTGPGQPGYPTGANPPGYPAGANQPGYPTGPSQPGNPGQNPSGYPGQTPSGYPGQNSGGYPANHGTPQSGGYSASQPSQGMGTPPQGGYGPGGPSQGDYRPPGQTGPSGTAGSRRPGQSDHFVSKVELRLECRNLLNKDVLSKSDPCAVLYMFNGGRWEEIGRTENVKNCLDPRFARAFVTDYYFEEVQKVKICVYDIDNTTPQLSDDDFLGQLETTLGQLVSNSPFTKPLVLPNGRKAGNGVITVQTEEIKAGTENVALTFHAKKLDKKDFLGKSDPFLEIQKSTQFGSWQVVHRTEVVKNNLNPSWRPFELPMHTLCGGNKQQMIKFDVYDWDSDGSHDYIGGFTANLEEMLKASQQEISWPCINPTKKAKKKSYTNSGIVLLSSCKLLKTYTFLDFIFGGMQINFTVGIDFTGSNGHPSKPTSLHYINPHQPNEYMLAIRAVGDVCQDYDTDKMFPALGFGAKIPPNPEVMHEFAINFNPQNPYCAGIDGVLQAYFNCIQRVQLYGPTNASPIIDHVARFASAAQGEEGQKGAHAYYVLLMLTDGVLSDMSNTRQSIVHASRLPMSLIIVGVGNADFTDMNVLDGDDGVLRAPSGEMAKRDIVQFVPFRDFKRSSSVELARCVLAEVPKQVTDYYKMRNILPNKPASSSS